MVLSECTQLDFMPDKDPTFDLDMIINEYVAAFIFIDNKQIEKKCAQLSNSFKYVTKAAFYI